MTDRGDRIEEFWRNEQARPTTQPVPVMAAPGQPGSPLQDNSKFTFSNLPVNPGVIAEIAAMCQSKGWRTADSGSREGPEFAAYVALGHSEFTEALEEYRDKVWSDTCPASTGLDGERAYPHHPSCSGKRHDHAKPVGIGPELADVIIRVLDMCDIWDIDINRELIRVIEYGWTRPYKHGGRDL